SRAYHTAEPLRLSCANDPISEGQMTLIWTPRQGQMTLIWVRIQGSFDPGLPSARRALRCAAQPPPPCAAVGGPASRSAASHTSDSDRLPAARLAPGSRSATAEW